MMRYEITNLNEITKIMCDYTYISFDLFDTLIFRKCNNYESRSKKLCKHFSEFLNDVGVPTDEFELYFLREGFFKKTKKRTNDEVDYYEYLQYLTDFFNISSNAEIKEKLLEIETEYEMGECYVNPEAKQALNSIKNNKIPMIVISDMYLPKKSILKILKKLEINEYFEEIFISESEGHRTKDSGWLFNYIASCTKYKNVLHVGDNIHSDFENALINSFSACHYKNKIKYDKSQISICKNYKSDMVDLLCKAFSHFISEVISKSRYYDSKEIFLLTRDMDFTEICFNHYVKMHNLDFTIKVLHIDRINSFFLNINTIQKLIDKLFIFKDKRVSFEGLLKQIDIEKEYLKNPKLKPFLDKDPYFVLSTGLFDETILEIISKKRENVVQYINSMGLLCNNNISIVDVGYSGTVSREICEYICENNIQTGRIDCYFFATNSYLESNLILTGPPVYLHNGIEISQAKFGNTATANFCWLEPFTLNSKLGSIQYYDGIHAIRQEFKDVQTNYDAYDLVSKIILNFTSKHNDISAQLIYRILFPKKIDLKLMSEMKQCKSYTNDCYEKIICSKLQLKQQEDKYGYMVCNDYWLGGSVSKAKMRKFLEKRR